MGLFKRRVAADDLIRGHLERLGVSPFWLRSALDAIRYCEQGEYFQPVFSVAGPAPARSVIALLRLEPYVQGEIDWNVSPSESPFWVGSVGDLRDERALRKQHLFQRLAQLDDRVRRLPAHCDARLPGTSRQRQHEAGEKQDT